MDNSTLGTVLTVLLGGGGLAALINSVQALRSKRAGVPATEPAAVAHIEARNEPAPDWTSLNDYWLAEMRRKDSELDKVKAELAAVRISARRRDKLNAARIDQLEQHIWLQLPAPPPQQNPPREG